MEKEDYLIESRASSGTTKRNNSMEASHPDFMQQRTTNFHAVASK